MSYLTEAFKALEALNEDTFDVSADGIKKLAEFEDNDDLIDEVTVFDAEADDKEDLEDSYVGKVIVDCNVCHSKIYKDKEDIHIAEETQNANIKEECPYCYSTDGFKVVGEVAPMTTETEKKNDSLLDESYIKTPVGEIYRDRDAVERSEDSPYSDLDADDDESLDESLTEASVTDYKGSLSNILVKYKEELGSLTSKKDILEFLDKITPEVKDQKYLEIVKHNMQKKNDFGAIQYLYDIILSGEGDKVIREDCDKNLKEDSGEDIGKYQEWVDCDIKRYGRISAQTNKEIKEAGLQIVKDKYGDFEVIAGDTKIEESIGNETIEDIEDFIADVKDRFPGSEAIYDGDNNTVKITLNNKDASLTESIDNVNVTTDTDIVNVTSEENGKVTVSTEPVEHNEEPKEVIVPISDETEKDIKDVDIDEFDDESFDELGESYLKEVYDNVDSYKTSKVQINDNKFMVEGRLKFTNGKEKKLSFMFESNKRSKDGKLNILGESLNIAKGQKAFSVIGKADGKKFISESLNYNYRVKNNNGNSTRCKGTVKRG